MNMPEEFPKKLFVFYLLFYDNRHKFFVSAKVNEEDIFAPNS